MDSTHSAQLNLETIDDIPQEKRHPEAKDYMRDRNRDVLDDVFRGEIFYRERLFKFCFYGLFVVTTLLALAMVFAIFNINVQEEIDAIWKTILRWLNKA